MTTEHADRFNEGKTPYHLIPPAFLEGLAKVLQMGAEKYSDWNWAKGFPFSNPYASLQRHLLAWYNGQDTDPESGLNHLDHVVANAMFLRMFQAWGRTDLDDRDNLQNHLEPTLVDGDLLRMVPGSRWRVTEDGELEPIFTLEEHSDGWHFTGQEGGSWVGGHATRQLLLEKARATNFGWEYYGPPLEHVSASPSELARAEEEAKPENNRRLEVWEDPMSEPRPVPRPGVVHDGLDSWESIH